MQEKYSYLKSLDHIFIHDTGIFDSHQYGLSLLRDFENKGGLVNYLNTLDMFYRKDGNFILQFKDTEYKISCKNLFLFAGFNTIEILKKSNYEDKLPKQILSKGDYFSYSGSIKSNHLIYPVPNEFSLGTHLTTDLEGKIKFGPDSTFVTSIDYKVNEEKKVNFLKKINDFIPGIKHSEINADYAGIRPKIEINGNIYKDFYPIFKIYENSFFCTILGYESPGLTSSLATSNMIYTTYTGG